MKTSTYISLLRGVNVSGQKTIRMPELKNCYESLSFTDVRTYLQSGNVVFDSPAEVASKLAAKIQAEIERTFGYAVAVFIREPPEFRRILDGNPFTHARNEDPAKLHVTFLYEPPSTSGLSASDVPHAEADEFFIKGREIFLFCPHGYGRTRLSNGFFERTLKMQATTRNWKTVNALYSMANDR